MVGCPSFNCTTAPWSLQANPDISGVGVCTLILPQDIEADVIFGFLSVSERRPISHFSFALYTISSIKRMFQILLIGSFSDCSCHLGVERDPGRPRNGLKLCKARSLRSVISNPSPVSQFSSVDIANLHVDWPSIIGR